jgi:hypothetical protein
MQEELLAQLFFMRVFSQMLPSLHVVHTLPLRSARSSVYTANCVTNFLRVQGEKKKASHINHYESQLCPLLEVQDLPAFARHFGRVNSTNGYFPIT